MTVPDVFVHAIRFRNDLVPRLNAAGQIASDLIPAGAGGGVQNIVAGPGISVDSTDPLNPVVSSAANEAILDTELTYASPGDGVYYATPFSIHLPRPLTPGNAILFTFSSMIVMSQDRDTRLKIRGDDGQGHTFDVITTGQTQLWYLNFTGNTSDQATFMKKIVPPDAHDYTYTIWAQDAGAGVTLGIGVFFDKQTNTVFSAREVAP